MGEGESIPRRRVVQEEIGAGQREERRKVRQQADALVALIAHPGWAVYRDLITQAAQNAMQVVQAPLKSQDEVFKVEFTKGTLNGLSAALMIPQGKIEEAKAQGLFEDSEAPAAGKD